MQHVKDPSTAQHVRIAAGAAIALKMVVPVVYAAKKKRPPTVSPGDACLPYSDTYLIMIFCVSLSLLSLSVTISMYSPVRSPVIDILSS